MIFRSVLFILFYLSFTLKVSGQLPIQNKKITAIRTETRISIDAVHDEEAWAIATPATDFIELSPSPGKKERFRTEIRILYDDFSLYIGAKLFDNSPDSILKEFSLRDQINNTDWFMFQIDPYKTGQIAFEFGLTASGVQIDRKVFAPNNRDVTWDVVWMSHVVLNEDGWSLEMEIPYSALRFPTTDIQDWNVNFARYIRRYREEYWWNPIDPSISNRLHQSGSIVGIHGIKAPPRISVTPFLATYFSHRNDRDTNPWRHRITGGLDAKIGLSDAFTLDVTLIPDFGQVRFDNLVLNLTPFEIQLQENRPFFTEGTELFNRGGIFYSRRIGDRPFFLRQDSWRLQPGINTGNLPQTSPLINASKFSGRTNSGLGIGVFNALENRLFIQATDENQAEIDLLVNPLTNYNVAVIDKVLPNNSFIAFANTNVWREGSAYNANVSAVDFAIRDQKNAYMISGKGAYSLKYNPTDQIGGYSYLLNFEKTKGSWQYKTSYQEISNNYDPNDLGFLPRNNERIASATLHYNIFAPTGFLNFANASLRTDIRSLYLPYHFARLTSYLNSFFMTRNFFAFGVNGSFEPIKNRDYFDPRKADFSSFYQIPENYSMGGFISTDYRRKFAYDLNGNYHWFNEKDRFSWLLRFNPRFRFNDHLFMIYGIETQELKNDIGFAARNTQSIGIESLRPEDVLYSRRNQFIVTNSISGRYNFDPLHSITLGLRHYWTGVDFTDFYILNAGGGISQTEYTGLNVTGQDLHGLTFTLFNIDLIYTWRFAPGSDLILVWKNTLNSFDQGVQIPFFDSVSGLYRLPQDNSISLRLIYYLDYALMKRNLNS
jgi:hypothetical protein